MHLGLRADKEGRTAALRVIGGFACNEGFVFSLFYLGENRAFGDGPFAFERADLWGTLACMLIAFALLRMASPRARDALLSRPLVWCYAGLPAGFMLAAWGRALGRRPVGDSVPQVFLSAAVAAGVCLLAVAIAAPQAAFALKLLPLGSAFALRGLLPTRAAASEGTSQGGSLSFGDLLATKEQRDETARLSKKIIAGTVLFGLAAGFMETFGSDPGMASTPTVLASLLLLVLFCIASLQLLGVSLGKAGDPAGKTGGAVDGPLDGVYRLAVLVMMAGFLFVPVLGSFGVPGEAIVLAGYLGLTFVLVSLFLVMAKITGQDAAVSFARGFAALYAGELAGIACGNGIELLEPAGQVPYAVAAFAGLAALYAYLFLFTERDFRALSVIVRDADRFDDACRLIASEHGLSKREAEILPLALKGRTGERIAAEFFISKSTVDTHLRRIYVKTGTHGRQELIDLGERTSQDLARRG